MVRRFDWVFTRDGGDLWFVQSIRAVEEPPENSEEADRAKRIIYWLMAVFVAAPLAILLYRVFWS